MRADTQACLGVGLCARSRQARLGAGLGAPPSIRSGARASRGRLLCELTTQNHMACGAGCNRRRPHDQGRRSPSRVPWRRPVGSGPADC